MSNPPFNPLMAQAQQSLQNPSAQAVPQQAAGGAGILQHPVVQAIIKALQSGTQAYGWTAMPPEERVQRTGLEQQKADTLARLAQTGAYQQGELAYRGQLADVAQQNAETRQGELKRKSDMDKFRQGLQQQEEERKVNADKVKAALGQGRLNEVIAFHKQDLAKFEQNYALAKDKFGDEQARTMLMGQALGIKQQMADTLQTAMSQRGTEEGMKAIQSLGALQTEHPLATSIMQMMGIGVPDVATQATRAQSIGIPGTTPPAVGQTNQPAPAAAQPAIPTNKVQAKQNQHKGATKGATAAPGVTHIWTPNGIQPVGGQQQ